MTDKEVMQQALEALKYNGAGGMRYGMEAITALKAALEQQAKPEQEPVAWMSSDRAWMWSNYSKAIAAVANIPTLTLIPLYVAPPLPVQPEPVKLRRGDTLRCIETDELCTVWATSTTGKTLIKWSANNFGNYTAEQIGELFWIEQQAEPVTWDRPSASFNEWWNGDYEDPANPFEKDSHGYWAFEGWQAAQRPWVGLTEDEKFEMAAAQYGWEDLLIAAEAKLKEKNHG